jgi:signal transduction histidine kinase
MASSIAYDIAHKAEIWTERAHRTTIDLSDAVDEALAIVQPVGKPTIEVSIEVQFPRLTIDRRRLFRLLVHLISNALARTAPEGVVKILGDVTPNGEVEIVVADTGAGPNCEPIDLSREPNGGIRGLSYAKSLASSLGGSIRIASLHGDGNVVTISFPVESVFEAQTRALADRVSSTEDRGQPYQLHFPFYADR